MSWCTSPKEKWKPDIAVVKATEVEIYAPQSGTFTRFSGIYVRAASLVEFRLSSCHSHVQGNLTNQPSDRKVIQASQ